MIMNKILKDRIDEKYREMTAEIDEYMLDLTSEIMEELREEGFEIGFEELCEMYGLKIK